MTLSRMSRDFERANVPVFVCLVSFCFGVATFLSFFWARTLPETDSGARNFAFAYLPLLAAASLLSGLFGASLLPYAIFSPTRGPLRPLLLKCAFYLLPSIVLGLALAWVLLRSK
ncbi:MAG: hypothetical protein JWR69_865 [Pedosphaera sp.]|nr:hypothetical protein [Pedosphaera sp.]